MKPVLVLKVGTAAITSYSGEMDEEIVREICRQSAELQKRYHLILVSSGAVGLGKKFMTHFLGKLGDRKAAASIGNPILIGRYANHFHKYGISVAQALCERHHFSNRAQFLQLRETFEELWKNNVLPVVNENDVVSNREIKFSDNDELATLLAVGFSAEKLLLGTVQEGLLDDTTLVREIHTFDEHIFSCVKEERSEFGLGGMLSKLHCARLATNFGVATIIFDIRKEGNVLLAEKFETGTVCKAQACNISAHQKWMASGSLSTGKVIVDEGARKALQDRKSLLLVGVIGVEGDFEKRDILKICTKDAFGNTEVFAVARAKISSRVIREMQGGKGVEVAHADEIVLF
ncbi:glutamate 5-kinase [Candidatus Gracilibacteria bacterium]|nr:glutamate 5-kinase [Candidatus Gracilibacteria bacterium]